MQRVQLDLKAAAGRDAFLRLAGDADVVIESFRPGVVDRLGIGYDDGAGGEPAASSTARPPATARTARTRSGPATTSTTSRSAATSTARAATPTAGRRCPARRSADGAGGGMHAVIAILAALVRRGRDRRGRVPRRVGRRRRARADVAVHRRVPRHRRRARARATTSSPAATPATTSTRARDGKWLAVGAIEPQFFANLCRALGCEQWIDHQTRRRGAGRDPRRLPRPRSRPATATSGSRSSARPTRACRAVASVPEVVDDPHFARARRTFVRRARRRARRRSASSAGCSPAWTDTERRRSRSATATVTDTDELLARRRASTDDEIAALREEGVVA